jgi:hypothetical protein
LTFLIENRFTDDGTRMTQSRTKVISDSWNYSPFYVLGQNLVPGICLRLSILCLISFVLPSQESIAQANPSGEVTAQNQSLLELTQEERSLLAERYAPELVYHAAEVYFPCNPLFALELKAASPGLQSMDHDSAISRLGTAESRKATYLNLTIEEKANLATVYYRVYASRRRSEDIVVIEYWLYYVQNVYRARASILPLWFDVSHPNDLEHLHVVLRVSANGSPNGENSHSSWQFTIEEVYASAHEGMVPANRYRHFDQSEADSIKFLMERGSHASAADIDRDGRFTPGRDGDSGYKMLWGIRDRGIPWIRYSRSYMFPRLEQNSITFFHEGSESPQGNDSGGVLQGQRFAYRLVPVEKLARDFAGMELTAKQQKEAFESQVCWIMRAIGRSNGNSGKLLLPREPEVKENSLNIENFASTERGFMVGGTNLIAEPGVFVGGRYAFLNGKKYLPDLMLEADGILTTKGKGYLSTQFLLTYPIDATTKLMGGYGFVTDSLRFDRRQWDWIAAIEARLGYIRIYGAMRTWGFVTRSAVDFRISYFF